MMGAYIILFPRAQILSIVPIFFVGMITEVPALVVIGLWILVQFFNAQFMGGGGLLHGGGVAYYAHVGGFLAGLVLILLLGGRALAEQRDEHRWDNYYR
jgi:membrane associated rhomboid family serine protease